VRAGGGACRPPHGAPWWRRPPALRSPRSLLAAGGSPTGTQAYRPEWEVIVSGGYQLVRQLGRGQYGTAHLVHKDDGGEEAVAKVVFLDHLKDRDRALALQEVDVLKRLQHPNIVRHHASWLHNTTCCFPPMQGLVTIMDYCAGGDLRDRLDVCARSGEHLPESTVLSLFAQMLMGIAYVHRQKILHRDLKTSNMLLDSDHRTVKIGDFGIARILESTIAVAVTMLGTPFYMSPEVCKGEPYREKSDMWSMGCVLYEMCMLRHAFESQSLLGLVYCIVSEHYDPIPTDRCSPTVSELVDQLLQKPADERPSAEQVLCMEAFLPHLSSDGLADVQLAAGSRSSASGFSATGPDVRPRPPPQVAPEVLSPDRSPMSTLPRRPLDSSLLPRSTPTRMQDGISVGRERQMFGTSPKPARPSVTASRGPPQILLDQAPRPPTEPPPPGLNAVSALPCLPKLRRPAPPQASCRWVIGGAHHLSSSPHRPTGRQLHFEHSVSSPLKGAERCVSPTKAQRCPAAAASFMPWTEVGYELQVLLARARGALLRRPRSLGNWVQAFAHHDTTGQGLLGAPEFAAFLESLSLGLSHLEAKLVTECLTGERGAVSLGGFSEAITHSSPSDVRSSEAWAADTLSAMAGSLPGGLATFAARRPAEVFAEHLLPSGAVDVGRLVMWLPKTKNGDVDWVAAEEWRAAVSVGPLQR